MIKTINTTNANTCSDTVTIDRKLFTKMSDSFATGAGFDLHQNDDGTYDLIRWFGCEHKPKVCLHLFSDLTLQEVISICDHTNLEGWEEVDDCLNPLRVGGVLCREDEQDQPLDDTYINTDLFLTPDEVDPTEDNYDYGESIGEHHTEILKLAIADFER